MFSRMRRRDYLLFNVAFGVGVFFFAVLEGGDPAWIEQYAMIALPGLFLGLAATFVMAIRRLQDFNDSGWWCPLLMLPVTNIILGLVLLVKDGTRGPNRYGEDPKGREPRQAE